MGIYTFIGCYIMQSLISENKIEEMKNVKEQTENIIGNKIRLYVESHSILMFVDSGALFMNDIKEIEKIFRKFNLRIFSVVALKSKLTIDFERVR